MMSRTCPISGIFPAHGQPSESTLHIALLSPIYQALLISEGIIDDQPELHNDFPVRDSVQSHFQISLSRSRQFVLRK